MFKKQFVSCIAPMLGALTIGAVSAQEIYRALRANDIRCGHTPAQDHDRRAKLNQAREKNGKQVER